MAKTRQSIGASSIANVALALSTAGIRSVEPISDRLDVDIFLKSSLNQVCKS